MQSTEPQPTETTPPKEGRNWFSIIFIAILVILAGKVFYDRYAPIANAASPENAIHWETDFDNALAQAAAENKEVLVRFSADWCPPCKVMKRRVWPDADVADSVNENYIPLDLDVDEPAASHLASRYGVAGIPAIFRLDSEGNVIARTSFMQSPETLKFLAAAASERP